MKPSLTSVLLAAAALAAGCSTVDGFLGGDKLDYLKAVVRLASERDDLGPDFRDWLRGYVPTLDA